MLLPMLDYFIITRCHERHAAAHITITPRAVLDARREMRVLSARRHCRSGISYTDSPAPAAAAE